MRVSGLILAGLVWAASACAKEIPPPRTLVQEADLPLPGGSGRFDYLSLDPGRSRLFVAHMGEGHLLVVDTAARKILADLDGFPGATGVLVVPELQKVFVSVTGRREVAVLDELSLKVLARLPAGAFPDGLAYAPKEKRVFVSDESKGVEAILDAVRGTVVSRVPLGGEAGNTQFDPISGHILVLLQNTAELLELDPMGLQILARHHFSVGQGPHGLLVDAKGGLAFVACEDDDKLLVLGLKDFKVRQVLSTGHEPDVLAWDPGLKQLYVACESGVLSVFERRASAMEKLEDAFAGKNGHSVAVDPRDHRLYIPLRDLNGHPVLRVLRPAGP
jgi:hypothetical protein